MKVCFCLLWYMKGTTMFSMTIIDDLGLFCISLHVVHRLNGCSISLGHDIGNSKVWSILQGHSSRIWVCHGFLRQMLRIKITTKPDQGHMQSLCDRHKVDATSWVSHNAFLIFCGYFFGPTGRKSRLWMSLESPRDIRCDIVELSGKPWCWIGFRHCHWNGAVRFDLFFRVEHGECLQFWAAGTVFIDLRIENLQIPLQLSDFKGKTNMLRGFERQVTTKGTFCQGWTCIANWRPMVC